MDHKGQHRGRACDANIGRPPVLMDVEELDPVRVRKGPGLKKGDRYRSFQ